MFSYPFYFSFIYLNQTLFLPGKKNKRIAQAPGKSFTGSTFEIVKNLES